jgi:hypothetical protein
MPVPCEECAMELLRRLGGAIVLLLSTVGIVSCLAGVVGAWVFRQEASERVQAASARIDVGLQRASAANQNVRRAVGKARADVAEVSTGSGDLGEGGEKGRRASRTLRTVIQKQVGPNIDDLGGRVATLSDAAVAVSSLLQSFQELPPGRTGRINPDQLERWGDEGQQLSAKLRRLEAVVGDGEKETGGREVADAASEVDLILLKCQAKADDWQTDLDGSREKLQHVKAEILGWLTLGAVAVTLLCVWVAAGQVSLFAHALPWCTGSGAGAQDAPGSLRSGKP